MKASFCGPFFKYYLGEIHVTIYNIEHFSISPLYMEFHPRRLFRFGMLCIGRGIDSIYTPIIVWSCFLWWQVRN